MTLFHTYHHAQALVDMPLVGEDDERPLAFTTLLTPAKIDELRDLMYDDDDEGLDPVRYCMLYERVCTCYHLIGRCRIRGCRGCRLDP